MKFRSIKKSNFFRHRDNETGKIEYHAQIMRKGKSATGIGSTNQESLVNALERWVEEHG